MSELVLLVASWNCLISYKNGYTWLLLRHLLCGLSWTLGSSSKCNQRKPKLSRHIKLNHTNIALLLQEATQKYRKLTDYRTKCCYLSLLFSLLIATCASFAFLNGRVFSVLGHSFERHKWSFVLYIVPFSALKISFSKLSLARYHCLHKNHGTYFMSSVTTKLLYRSLFYKFFCTNLPQVVLTRLYTERFLCNTICVALICLICSFHTNPKRQNSSDLLGIVSSTFQCRKLWHAKALFNTKYKN